jgi:hypothetical protein
MNALILLVSVAGLCIAVGSQKPVALNAALTALSGLGILAGMIATQSGAYLQGNAITLVCTVAFAVYWKATRAILVPEYWSRRERKALAMLFPKPKFHLIRFLLTSPALRHPQ